MRFELNDNIGDLLHDLISQWIFWERETFTLVFLKIPHKIGLKIYSVSKFEEKIMGMRGDFWTRNKDGSTWPAKCRVKNGSTCGSHWLTLFFPNGLFFFPAIFLINFWLLTPFKCVSHAIFFLISFSLSNNSIIIISKGERLEP